MRKVQQVLLAMVLTAAIATQASAQACLGMPSFEGRSVHLNAGGEFPDSARAYTIGLGAGKPNGLFANLGGGQVSYDGLDSSARLGFLEFGFEYPLAGLRFCPVAGGYFAMGPDDELARISVTSRAATGGIAVGYPLDVSSLTLIPNASVKYEYLNLKVEEEDVGSLSDTFQTTLLDLGLALILYQRLSIQPLLHVPLSGEDKKTSIGVFASVGFGLP
jgi:hypothetical protein